MVRYVFWESGRKRGGKGKGEVMYIREMKWGSGLEDGLDVVSATSLVDPEEISKIDDFGLDS